MILFALLGFTVTLNEMPVADGQQFDFGLLGLPPQLHPDGFVHVLDVRPSGSVELQATQLQVADQARARRVAEIEGRGPAQRVVRTVSPRRVARPKQSGCFEVRLSGAPMRQVARGDDPASQPFLQDEVRIRIRPALQPSARVAVLVPFGERDGSTIQLQVTPVTCRP